MRKTVPRCRTPYRMVRRAGLMEAAYFFQGGFYLNLTNRCPTACVFCIKRTRGWDFYGRDLRLGAREPSAEVLEAAVSRALKSRPLAELVFCGLGESTYRLPVLRQVAEFAKGLAPRTTRRLNTIGLGSLIWGRDIAPELAQCLDSVSVSLNTADPEQWIALHAPRNGFREKGFAGALAFVSSCARAGLKTTVTAIERPDVDLDAVMKLAQSLGAGFRIRPPLAPV